MPQFSIGDRSGLSHQSSNILQELTNLIYLTRIESGNQRKVVHYMELSTTRVKDLTELLAKRAF